MGQRFSFLGPICAHSWICTSAQLRETAELHSEGPTLSGLARNKEAVLQRAPGRHGLIPTASQPHPGRKPRHGYGCHLKAACRSVQRLQKGGVRGACKITARVPSSHLSAPGRRGHHMRVPRRLNEDSSLQPSCPPVPAEASRHLVTVHPAALPNLIPRLRSQNCELRKDAPRLPSPTSQLDKDTKDQRGDAVCPRTHSQFVAGPTQKWAQPLLLWSPLSSMPPLIAASTQELCIKGTSHVNSQGHSHTVSPSFSDLILTATLWLSCCGVQFTDRETEAQTCFVCHLPFVKYRTGLPCGFCSANAAPALCQAPHQAQKKPTSMPATQPASRMSTEELAHA